MITSYLAEIAWLMIAFAMLVAAASKSRDLRRFADALIDNFQVPIRFGMSVAVAVVAAEWSVVALLFAGDAIRIVGIGLASMLLLLFSAVIAAVLWRKQPVFCHCFGRARQPLSALDLIRNGIFLVACLMYAVWGQAGANHELLAQLALIMAAGLCFLLSVSLSEINTLLREPA